MRPAASRSVGVGRGAIGDNRNGEIGMGCHMDSFRRILLGKDLGGRDWAAKPPSIPAAESFYPGIVGRKNSKDIQCKRNTCEGSNARRSKLAAAFKLYNQKGALVIKMGIGCTGLIWMRRVGSVHLG